MRSTIVIAALCLSACTTQQKPVPEIVPRDVSVAVRATCVPADFPTEPDYPDTDDALLAAPNMAGRYALAIAGREKRKARQAASETVIAGCR